MKALWNRVDLEGPWLYIVDNPRPCQSKCEGLRVRITAIEPFVCDGGLREFGFLKVTHG